MPNPAPRAAPLIASACLGLLAVRSGLGCSEGNCEDQSCDRFGGSASRTVTSCYTDRYEKSDGSSEADFFLEDGSGDEFFRCTSVKQGAATDDNGCDDEFVAARFAFCGDDGGSGVSAASAASSGGAGAGTSTSAGTTGSGGGGGGSGPCPFAGDGQCDEPGIGTGLCPVGSDPDDCA